MWWRLKPALTTVIGPRFAAIAGILLVWVLIHSVADPVWLPSLGAVFNRVVALWGNGQIESALGESLGELGAGYLVILLIGGSLGAAMASSSTVDEALRVYVDAFLFLPPIVFAPIFISLFGVTSNALVAMIASFGVSVLASHVKVAMRGSDARLKEMARSFGASPAQVLILIVMRQALPEIFAGLTTSLARAVKGMIIGELIVTSIGLGGLENEFDTRFDAIGIWSITFVIVGLALLLTTLLEVANRAVNAWAYGGHTS